MNKEDAKMSLDAVVLGIKGFTEYAAQLSEFDKKTREAVERLGQSHRDQNYLKFKNFFMPLWQKMDSFKKETENFRMYLDEEKKRLEGYILAGKTDNIL